MRVNVDGAKSWSEVVKNLTQVLALFVAAVWTYLVFVRTEKPALEGQASIDSTLGDGVAIGGGGCAIAFEVSLQNQGKTGLDVESVRLRAWPFESPTKPPKLPQIVSVKVYEADTKPIVDITVSRTSLLGHRSPGEGAADTFQVNLPAGYPPGVLLDATLIVSIGGRKSYEMYTYRWGRTCP